ncbi:MAG: N-acetyltransferase [bacterium]|nr:N-acetyltransferase [bacterium]
MMIRKAKIKDSKQIQDLVNAYAKEDKMLSRSLNDIYEHIRDFFVYEDEEGNIQGCCAMHIVWDNLAEIKALAVSAEFSSHGIARDMVQQCMSEAKALGIKKTFALTYVNGFFKKMGFKEIKRDNLPHKVWRECIYCPKFPGCDEIAVEKDLG